MASLLLASHGFGSHDQALVVLQHVAVKGAGAGDQGQDHGVPGPQIVEAKENGGAMISRVHGLL